MTVSSPTAQATIATIPQTISLRRVENFQTKPGGRVGMHVDDVVARLQARRDFEQPSYIQRSPSQFLLDCGDGSRHALLHPVSVGSNGRLASEGALHLTHNGLRSLSRHVLPAHGMKTMEALLRAGEEGRKLVNMNWATLAKVAADKPVVLRTYNTHNDKGEVVRAARACVSGTYTIFDNLELMKQISQIADFRRLPVVAWSVTDTSFRCRFALQPLDRFDLQRPIEMLEVWNNEIGTGSVRVGSGMYRGLCSNGMISWTSGFKQTWRHTGNVERIATGIPDTIESIRIASGGLMREYDEALKTSVDDAHSFLDEIFAGTGGSLSGEQIRRSVEGLAHETTTDNGSLAALVDGVSWAAQAEIDPLRQQAMEEASIEIMQAGLRLREGRRLRTKAARNGDRVVVATS